MDKARSRQRRDRGAAAVEFALVLPILLLIIFGLIDFGRMLNAQITLTEAAREGARADALTTSASQVSGAVRSRVDAASSNLGTSGTVGFTTPGVCANGDDDAKVSTTYKFKFVTPVGALAKLMGGTLGGDLDLKGAGVMPCRG